MKIRVGTSIYWQSKGSLQQTADLVWMRNGQMENDLRDY